MRKMGPPARAPPPKMRDLFVAPQSTPVPAAYDTENVRCDSVASSNASGSVRQISPEDVYDDRERMSYLPSSMAQTQSSERNTPQTYRDVQASSHYNHDTRYHPQPSTQTHHHYQQQQYIPTADSRQISSTSTTSTSQTAASGSENWETFDDASEPEVDASEAYYAKLRANAHGGVRQVPSGGKRFTPEGGYTPPGKKFRGGFAGGNGGAGMRSVVEVQGDERRMVTGSESAWTDEDAF